MDLQRNIERIANGVKADWGIYIKFTASGDEIALNADASMDTKSDWLTWYEQEQVTKIPPLLSILRARRFSSL